MSAFKNSDGRFVLLAMVKAIQENKAYLSEVDGLIGDGDHGMNMNKGFSVFASRLAEQPITFAAGLNELGTILMNEIGGSMGPIYGTIFTEMAEAGEGRDEIGLADFARMLEAGLSGLQDIVDARVGDKTLLDTLSPAVEVVVARARENGDFKMALADMQNAAVRGRDSTKDMVARHGRSARLGERSRGVLDAGATSCCILLSAMAEAISEKL